MIKFLNPIFKSRKNENASREHVAMIESISKSLETLDVDVSLMRMELMILSASGKWLDAWGDWFGVPRLTGEPDDLYSKRIIATTIKPKNTIPAIIDSVNELGGDPNADTTIFEPHKFIARYGVSAFSGLHRYQDADYWRIGVIDINSPFYVTQEFIDAINNIKAAGVRVYYTNNTQIWIPDDPNADKFSKGFNVIQDLEAKSRLEIAYPDDEELFKSLGEFRLGDYTISIEPALSISLKGAVFSSNTHSPRQRSGKQTLWGTFVDLALEFNMERFYERYIEDSEVLKDSDFLKLTYPEVAESAVFSGKYVKGSVLSGGKLHQVIEEIVYPEDGKTDLQGAVQHNLFSLRPATRSHHAVFSGSYAFSGAPGDDWVDKPFVVIPQVVAKFIYKKPVDRVTTEHTLIHEISLAPTREFNKSIRSGRQILFASDLVTLYTDLTMSQQKRAFTFENPYKWKDFLYAVAKGDTATQLDLIAGEGEIFSSVTTIQETEEWGINIQRPDTTIFMESSTNSKSLEELIDDSHQVSVEISN